MNYFLKKYCQILSKLENYKKNLIHDKKNINKKYVNDIDELLLQKYIKIESFLKDYDK